MVINGFNLDQTRKFEIEVEQIKAKITTDCKYKKRLLSNNTDYEMLKKYFEDHLRFLKYVNEIEIEHLYRVRKLEDKNPYTKRKQLIYPQQDAQNQHAVRMNNLSFSVMYVSMHEFTAISEKRINKEYINKYFQLTRFTTKRKLRVYKLGLFSELYMESPRDSQYVKDKVNAYFGNSTHDTTVQGYAGLECAIAKILYDQENDDYTLSSIMADAIYSTNPSIDAILYPTMQNRYGVNLALKNSFADELQITYTSVNQLKDVYNNGFYKYHTLQECTEFNNPENFIFYEINDACQYR